MIPMLAFLASPVYISFVNSELCGSSFIIIHVFNFSVICCHSLEVFQCFYRGPRSCLLRLTIKLINHKLLFFPVAFLGIQYFLVEFLSAQQKQLLNLEYLQFVLLTDTTYRYNTDTTTDTTILHIDM